jgi:hypothetical protein
LAIRIASAVAAAVAGSYVDFHQLSFSEVATALCPAEYQKVLGTQRRSNMVLLSFKFFWEIPKSYSTWIAGPTGVRAAKRTKTNR